MGIASAGDCVTIGVAWVAQRSDGRQDLYLASDSRTRGGRLFDLAPKLLPLPRSDAALCFSGDSAIAYPFMAQISASIAAHEPARDRNLDIGELLKHLLRLLTDTANNIRDDYFPFDNHDPEFIFAGYSWRAKDFRIWTISYEPRTKKFVHWEANNFHQLMRKAAFTGDWATRYRAALVKRLEWHRVRRSHINMEPMRLLADMLRSSGRDDSIGGAPQVLRIGPHMNTRPLTVLWGESQKRHLYGRKLLDYENCDYWCLDPDSGQTHPPDHFSI